MAVGLTVTIDEARLAARLEVTGIPAGADTLTILRQEATGEAVEVRGAVDVGIAGLSSYVARDYEAPFDTPLVYSVTVEDAGVEVGSATAAAVTIDYGDCPAWLVDLARPTNSLPLTIESMPELVFPIPAGVHRVLDRPAPVLTSLPAWTPETELSVITETLRERDQTRLLLGSGYPFLLRTDPEQGIGNLYLGPTQFREERFLTPGDAPQRFFRIACVEVERPDPAIYVPQAPNTYANVKADYASYGELTATALSYEELAYTYPT